MEWRIFDVERFEENKDEYNEKTPLILAIEKNNFEIFNLLLQNKNIDINIKCTFNSNWTKVPIGNSNNIFGNKVSSEEEEENEEIVGNINESLSYKNTALDIANQKENTRIIELLKKHK